MEELDRLKNKRFVIRSLTEVLLERVKTLPAETAVETTEELNAQLLEKEKLLLELDKSIELKIVAADEFGKEITDSQQFRDKTVAAKTILSRMLRHRRNEAPESSHTPSGTSSKSVRLPKFTMEKFSGDVSKWQEWWAQFESSFHENNSIGKIEKFSYLKTLLSGSAADSVAGLSLTEVNYDKAVEILKDRFGKNETIVSVHINKLLELAPVKNSTEIKKLRWLYDMCNVQIRNLESAGVKIDSYGNLLFPLLTKLLPEDIVLEFNRKNGERGSWNVLALLEFLRREIEGREQTAILRQQLCAGDASPRRPAESFRFSKSATNKRVSAATLGTMVRGSCVFCDSTEHSSRDCGVTSISERKIALKKRGRCFVCLKERHIAKFCKSKITCDRCHRRHNVLICERVQENAKDLQNEHPEGPAEVPQGTETVISSVSGNTEKRKVVLLQTAKVIAEGKRRRATIRCLIDGGSQRTFIRKDTSESLALPVIGEETLIIHAFGSNEPVTLKTRRVRMKLKDFRHPEIGLDIEALETPAICSASIQVPGRHIQKRLQEEGLEFADEEIAGDKAPEITLLIGSDFYWKVVTGITRRLSDSLMGIETIFGWMVHGPTNILALAAGTDTPMMKVIAYELSDTEEHRSYEILKNLWELEAIGVNDNQRARSSEVDAVLKQFKATQASIDGRYVVRLPWKDDHDVLLDNKDIALRRFEALTKKFRKNPELYYRYNEVIDSYLIRGIAERVEEEALDPGEKVYYMPHRAVIRDDRSTTKLRVVFDASSHGNDAPSLNDCLHSGPNLNPDLVGLLIDFRLYPIVFTADVEQAFLQIVLHEKDRNATRFFWFDGPLKPGGKVNAQVLRMTRVLFGVTSSPFLLAATIKHHVSKYRDRFPEACKRLDECLYVDDFVCGANDIAEALKLSSEAKLILEDAKMNLRKWRTNERDLLHRWVDLKGPVFELDTQAEGSLSSHAKVLGIQWYSDADAMAFDTSDVSEFVKDNLNTKRIILHAVGRIFDPLGFLTPFTIRARILFQELWKRKIGWDDNLPGDLRKEWSCWCAELRSLKDLRIPRYLFAQVSRDKVPKVELHCFTDASPTAYGAVLYVRFHDIDGQAVSTMVMSRARVSPIREISLPRLELMGALIGARLVAYVLPRIQKRYDVTLRLWTDSKIVLAWIRGDPQHWKIFVRNRVREILEKTLPQLWSYCPGILNPADLLTRGITAAKVKNNKLWWNGPEFLQRSEDEWPKEEGESFAQEESAQGVEENYENISQTSCASESGNVGLLDIGRYSNLNKLIKVTAWILRFANNCRQMSIKRSGFLTAEEIEAAQEYWIKESQMKSFGEEMQSLASGKGVSKISKIVALCPFLDNKNIIRLGGRLQDSSMSYEQVHPVILSGKDHISELIIRDSHEKIGHAGVSETLVQVRDRFWIVKGRQRVKNVIHDCSLCKRFRVKPVTQQTATLPPERINEAPPFQIVGVDFAGPLYLKSERKNEKGYILIFSCAVTRAIHLELVADMSLQSFLLAFKRFISRRGICKTVFSDNAKTFKATARELSEAWDHLRDEKLQEFFGRNGILWKFNVEHAAWWGGFWERLIRSVKSCLRKILGKALLKFDEMETTLIEIEAILNSRPLTYVYNTPEDPAPLTPGHFLIGRRLTSLPPRDESTAIPSSTNAHLIRRYKYREALLTQFWKRWRENYLLELRTAHSVHSKDRSKGLKAGSVVLIYDAKHPRLFWKIAIVTRLYFGRDGKVRCCELRLSNGNVITRPLQLLCPLELETETTIS